MPSSHLKRRASQRDSALRVDPLCPLLARWVVDEAGSVVDEYEIGEETFSFVSYVSSA